MSIKSLSLTLIILLGSLLLVSCDDGGSGAPAAPRVAKPAVKAAAVVPESAEEAAKEEYVYDPTGTRDPFKNPLGTLTELPVDSTIPLTPLQKFDIGQLRIIGVIVGKGEPRAMVVAPDNKSFILKKGTKVGRNNGSVVGITTDAVQVEEQYLDFSGDIKTTVQEIKLPKQGGVK